MKKNMKENKAKKMMLLLCLLFLLPINSYAVTIPDMADMLTNLDVQLPALWEFITALAYVAGFFMAFKGVYDLKKYGDPHSQMSGGKDLRPAIVTFIVGATLIYFPSMLQVGVTTLFGENGMMAYPTSTPVDQSFNQLGETIVYIVQFVGAVAFLRGIMYMHKIGSGQAQQGTFGKSITHLVGGTLCLNVVGTANVIASTLGISW
ncbi:MAG: hypothetical protein CMF49_02115 [Legionellales bacterium]|nr:hypothetical protein [Legionellales bacterium]